MWETRAKLGQHMLLLNSVRKKNLTQKTWVKILAKQDRTQPLTSWFRAFAIYFKFFSLFKLQHFQLYFFYFCPTGNYQRGQPKTYRSSHAKTNLKKIAIFEKCVEGKYNFLYLYNIFYFLVWWWCLAKKWN